MSSLILYISLLAMNVFFIFTVEEHKIISAFGAGFCAALVLMEIVELLFGKVDVK